MNLVYFSPVPLQSFAQRPHKFVEWFHKKYGGKILWIDPYPTRLPSLQDISRFKNKLEVNAIGLHPSWIEVIAPPAFPIEPLPFMSGVNKLLWRKNIDVINGYIKAGKCVIGIGKPSRMALEVLSDNEDTASFYDAMDDFPFFYSGLSRFSMKKMEEKVLSKVDKVYASSTHLKNRIQMVRHDVILMKNACCVETLPTTDKVLAEKKSNVIGYVGTIGKWFDWEFVVRLAKSAAEKKIHIIGPLHTAVPDELPKNIELFPSCSHADAIKAMTGFSIGIIPFKKNLLTRSVDPIKYYEYRALGLPVISTRFGEMALRDNEKHVYIADHDDDLPGIVSKAFDEVFTCEDVDQFRKAHSWEYVFENNFNEQNEKKVALLYVNYQSEDYLEKNLHFLKKQTLRPHRITVVNNSDAFDERFSSFFAEVNILQEGRNTGFAVANNDGIKHSKEEYIALLNPDAFPDPGWLECLVNAANEFPHIAAFGSRQMQADKPEYIDGIGDVYHVSGLAWREGHGRKIDAVDRHRRKIFSPCAGAALYRRDAFEAIGGFDEDFFCYMEDVDLGFRLQLAGYKSMYVPDAVVHHVGGASSGGAHSDFAVYHGHRNMVWVFIKNMPGILFWLFLPLHIFMNLVAIAVFSARGKGKIICRAKWDAILGIRQMWKKRQQIQAGRKVSIAYIWKIISKGIIKN